MLKTIVVAISVILGLVLIGMAYVGYTIEKIERKDSDEDIFYLDNYD